MMPARIGSRWRHASGNVYTYEGEDPDIIGCYCHVMKLVEINRRLDPTPLGHIMHVELPWFERAATEVR